MIGAGSVLALALSVALSACAGSSTPAAQPSVTGPSLPVGYGAECSGRDQPVLRWEFKTQEFGISGVPAVTERVVSVRGTDDSVHALDAESGRPKWKFKTGDASSSSSGAPLASSAAASDGLVYVAGDRGGATYVYALDAQSGAVRWKVGAGRGPIASSPVVADGVVYFGTSTFSALEGTTGHRIWEYGPSGAVVAAPAVGDGLVSIRVAGGVNGVQAIDAHSGQGKWVFAADPHKPSTPAVFDGVVYFAALGSLHAVDAETGEEQWAFQSDAGAISSPAVADGVVCFSSGSDLHAVDLETHQERWTFDHGPAVDSPPAVLDGVVYFGDNGTVYALDAQSGDVNWQFKAGGEDLSFSSPAVADGMVYIGGDDGHLYAIAVEPGRCSF